MKKNLWFVGLSLMMVLTSCSGENKNDPASDSGVNIDIGDETETNEKILYPSELEPLKEKIIQAQSGEPVDFDDDGFSEYQKTKHEDGSELVEMFKPSGAVYYQAEYLPDGSHVIYQDTNGDELTDIQETREINPFSEERLYDKDFDGYPEERLRVEYDESSQTIIIFHERDDDGDGDYTVLAEKTTIVENISERKQSRAITRGRMYHGPVEISWSGCDSSSESAFQNGLKIAMAAECALNHGKNCLNERNKKFYNKLIDTLANEKTIKVACSSGRNSVAWTPLDNLFWEIVATLSGSPDIFFNPNELDGLQGCASSDANCIGQDEDDKLCNILLHELLHYAEQFLPPNHDADGDDEIYSCARYCGGCAHNLKGATGDSHVDCLKCGGTLNEKLTCGYVEKIEEAECLESLGICHAGLGCIAGACEKCRSLYTKTCDQEILNETPMISYIQEFLCCSKCPDSCDNSNDFPCNSSFPEENTCHDPLPMCSK